MPVVMFHADWKCGVCWEIFGSSMNISPLLQGATIRRDEFTGAIVVARVMRGGAADRSGKQTSLIKG